MKFVGYLLTETWLAGDLHLVHVGGQQNRSQLQAVDLVGLYRPSSQADLVIWGARSHEHLDEAFAPPLWCNRLETIGVALREN